MHRFGSFSASSCQTTSAKPSSAGGSGSSRNVRVVPAENLHVTLAFLGSRPRDDVPAILETLRNAASRAAQPALTPVSWRETRSVGMLVLHDEGDAATILARDLHGLLEALGVYRPEARAWLPHVTVARFRERPRLRPPLPETGTFVPSGAAAYISRLHPAGARYEVLESTVLGGRTP